MRKLKLYNKNLKTVERNIQLYTHLECATNVRDTLLETGKGHPKVTLGLRVIVFTWLDSGVCNIKLADGAGNSVHWRIHEEVTLDDPTDEVVNKIVEEMAERSKAITSTFFSEGVDWTNWS